MASSKRIRIGWQGSKKGEKLYASADQSRSAAAPGRHEFSPDFELEENEHCHQLTIDVPGVRPEDINIEVTGNRLLVAGERRAGGKTAGGRFSKFQRYFTLPEGVDAQAIQAACKDGVLRLLIQKPSMAKTTKNKIAETQEPAALAN